MKSKVIVLVLLILIAVLLTGFLLIKDGEMAENSEAASAAAIGSKVEDSVIVPDIEEKEQIESSNTAEKVIDREREEPLKITAVGDILLGRGVGSRLEKDKKGYIYPFEKVADILKKGDIVFGNLEEPITEQTYSLAGLNKGGKIVLKNKVQAFDGIKYAGFNLFSLANNHILDYYDSGLLDTMDILNKNGIAYSGAGRNIDEARKPAIIEKKGLKIALLSYTDMADILYKGNPPISFAAGNNKYGVAPRKLEYIKEDIKRIRDSVDIIIISLHWGVEESFNVLPSQTEFAHTLLDEGADVILGHHPHQFQGIEIYKGKPIMYSLGNFIFDQNDPENQESFIISMEYADKKLISLSSLPVRTIGKTQVVPQKGADAANILEREVALSQKMGSKCSIIDDQIIFEVN